MIKKAASQLTKIIYKETETPTDLYNAYQYRIELMLSTLFNALCVITASIVLSNMSSGIIFLAVFVSLRSFIGGYRTKNYFMGSVLVLLTYLAVYYINFAAEFIDEGLLSRLLTALILLGIIPIIAFAPAHSKSLSEKYSRICRIMGIVGFILISIIALVLYYGGIKYGSFMILTLASVSVLILIEIL